MLTQVFRGAISVLRYDPSGFSMPGYLSLANRTRVFYTNFLSSLMYNFLCRSDCSITTYRNVCFIENLVRNFGLFEFIFPFPMRNIKNPVLKK